MNLIERLREYGFDLQIQERARRYQLNHLKLAIVEYATFLALLLLLALFGSAGLADWIKGFARSSWPLNTLYTLIFTIGLLIVGLPFSWWGYQIERHYGLSTQAPRSWLADELKGAVINLLIFLIAFPAIYVGILKSDTWWLIAWAIATLFAIMMGFITPVVLLPLFYKFVPLENEELVRRLKTLAIKAGVKIVGTFKMSVGAKTRKGIGALVGIGATRRIILSDTLLEHYTPDQIETVIAHELGHYVHQDLWKAIAGFSTLALLSFYIVHRTLGPLAGLFGLEKGIVSLPLFSVIIGGVFFIFLPLYNTLSRWVEGEADQYALELANRPEAQAQVHVKLCDQNLRYAVPHPVIEFLLYDHPAGFRRVERALEFREARADK
jgi:STE24 endopeptidase